MTAPESIDGLGASWRHAFAEAWESFRTGNFGIGAVLVDPASGGIVSRGRNRVSETDPAARTIGGNMMAHAEMNAFAAMRSFRAEGLHLYTTLEPCLMCAATSIMLRVEHVNFAAVDEFYVGLDDLWSAHEHTREHRPSRSGPIEGPIADFARLLPLVFTVRVVPDGLATERARRASPTLVELALAINHSGEFADLLEIDDVGAAFDRMLPSLPS